MSLRSTSFASYGPLLAAAAIAASVYLLVAVRFGQPLRDAKEAVAKASDVHERLPTYVERAVKKQVGPGINPEEIEKLRSAVADLNIELDKLRRSADRAETTATAARREAEDAKRFAAAVQVQASTATSATVMASPAPEHRPSPSDASGAPNPAEPTTSILQHPSTIVRHGAMQIELIGHRVTSRGVVVETRLTRLSGGDKTLYVYPPDDYPLVRIITSEGIELMRGQLTGSNGRTGQLQIAMVEGVPVRMTYLFEGKFTGSVLCSTIDLMLQEAGSGVWTTFRFSDILVMPE